MKDTDIPSHNGEKSLPSPLPSASSSSSSNLNGHHPQHPPSPSPSSSSSFSSSVELPVPSSHNNYSEISTNQRYIRFNDLISQDGKIKSSYKAFDTKNGTEIVWQKIILSELSEMEQNKIIEGANYLRAVRHPHILMYSDIWLTDKPKTLNLITSYLDTLKQFVNKIGNLRWRIIKKWCKQILQAIAYLHNSTPQIIHRNLTWRNIFVNPGVGDLYLGGLWLAAIIVETPDVGPISVSDALSTQYTGSAQYRAPEMTSECRILTTKMDIYSFGMCVLAMVTGTEPYAECDEDMKRIADLASRGVLPLALRRIENPLCLNFIESCLRLNPEERLSVEQLFEHPFLQPSEEIDDKVVSLGPTFTPNIDLPRTDITQVTAAGNGLKSSITQDSSTVHSTREADESMIVGSGTKPEEIIQNNATPLIDSRSSNRPPRHPSPALPHSNPEEPSITKTSTCHSPKDILSTNPELLQQQQQQQSLPQAEPQNKVLEEGGSSNSRSSLSLKPSLVNLPEKCSPNSSSVQVRVCSVPQGGVVTVQLRLGEGDTANGIIQDVEFLFHIDQDNYEVVAAEMKQELNLTISTDQLAILIQNQVDSVLHSVDSTKKNPPLPPPEASHEEKLLTSLENQTEKIESPTLSSPPTNNSSKTESQIDNTSIPIPIPAPPVPPPSLPPPLPSLPPPSLPLPISLPHPVPVPPPLPLSHQEVSFPQDPSELHSPRILNLSSKSDDNVNTQNVNTISNSMDEMHSSVSVPSSSSLLNSKSPTKLDESGFFFDANKPDDQSSVPRPDSDASPEELTEFTELLRELEKIDKECRAARRVFEQRIQKHKIIQDSCEEDLLKIESDYTAQFQQFEKSEIKAAQKKDESIALCKIEFENKIQQLREHHHHHHLHRQQPDRTSSTSSSTSSSLSSINYASDTTSFTSSHFSGIFSHNPTPTSSTGGSIPERTTTPSLGTSSVSIVKAKS